MAKPPLDTAAATFPSKSTTIAPTVSRHPEPFSYITEREGRERNRKKNTNRHFQMTTVLMWGFQEKETKTSTFWSQDNIFNISIIKTLQHYRNIWITLLRLLYFLKMCWFQLVLFPARSLLWLVCEPSWVRSHDKWRQQKQKTKFYIVWLCIIYGNSSNPTRNVGGFTEAWTKKNLKRVKRGSHPSYSSPKSVASPGCCS